MCGIAGFVGAGDWSDVRSMTAALTHRGPDGEGFYEDESERLFLGHRRLAILDVDGGRQPMWNEDRTVGVIFNGEIYNHLDLRRELESAGHIFHTSHSDTEVLVHGFEEWGQDLPRRLNGMFAFAVYDKRRRLLFLTRDRFGEKPLYYSAGKDLFAFASELSALLKHPRIDASLSVRSLQKYFAYGYIPAPHSLYRNVAKLPGGYSLTFDLVTGRHKVSSYWTFRLTPDERLSERREDELAEELRELIRQAVKRRLMSDVPLGMFLSGGVDSSGVVAAARSISERPLETFTVGFTEPSFDESAFARMAADHLGTLHHERVLDLSLFNDSMRQALRCLDEPMGDPSIVPTFLLSKYARENVTVALTGDGMDELFAGYDPFRALGPARLYANVVPKPLHGVMRFLSDRLPRSTRNMSFDFRLRRALTGLSYDANMWAPIWMCPVEPKAMPDIVNASVRAEELYEDAILLWERDPQLDPVDRLLEFFTVFYLQDDILAKVDRAAMSVSLETRAVYLDNDLVDFCRRLPNRFKLRNGKRKYLFKKAMAPLLPGEVVNRPKKGFGIPTAKWLREMACPAGTGTRLLNASRAADLWEEHRRGRADHRMFLWCWLVLHNVLGSHSERQLAAA